MAGLLPIYDHFPGELKRQHDEMAACIRELEARAQELEHEVHDIEVRRAEWEKMYHEAVVAASERAGELERALEPFAADARLRLGRDDDDRLWIRDSGGWLKTSLRVEHLRVARRALRGQAQGQEGGE